MIVEKVYEKDIFTPIEEYAKPIHWKRINKLKKGIEGIKPELKVLIMYIDGNVVITAQKMNGRNLERWSFILTYHEDTTYINDGWQWHYIKNWDYSYRKEYHTIFYDDEEFLSEEDIENILNRKGRLD